MKLNAYAIYDNKSARYFPPFFNHTDNEAVRNLTDLANDGNSTIAKHPGDYVMYFVGTYDDSNGQFWPEQPLRHVMDAAALVKLPDVGLFDHLRSGTAQKG